MFRSATCVLLVLAFASGTALASGSDTPFARDHVQATAATAPAQTPALSSRSDAEAAMTLRTVIAVVMFALVLVDLAAMGLLERLRDVGTEDPARDAFDEPLRLDAVLHS